MYIPFGVFSAGAGGPQTYELISTTVLGSATATVTLGSIPAGYKHIQVRATMRANGAVSANAIYLRMNSDSGSKYASHRLQADGAGVGSSAYVSSVSNGWAGYMPAASATTNEFGAMVLDVLDFNSTSKYKTWRSLAGSAGSNFLGLYSGVFMDTAAMTSIEFFHGSGSFIAGSRFSIYGIRG